MAIDSATFRSVLGRFVSGVTILTARDAAGVDHGMTASAFCSVSLDPPLVLASVAHDATLHPVLLAQDEMAVSVLTASQEAIARRFAEKLDNRFDGVGFTRGLTGAPLIEGALAVIEGRVVHRYAGGDHTVFIAEVLAASATMDEPLVYYRGGYAHLAR
jgi:3-hydroxy-9,10-secoandrosta-1,3,5(10)-triene-9,17-dione monooxygenase reductase component